MIELKQHRDNTNSQYGEDGIIAKILEAWAFKQDLSEYWCMDVGAWDGIKFSNIHALVERGASAVEIESDPARFYMLEANAKTTPRIHAVQASVSTTNIVARITAAKAKVWNKTALVLSVDVDGDHAEILSAIKTNPFQIVVVEWCNRGDRRQYEPLRDWGDKAGFVCVAKTNANLVFVLRGRHEPFQEVIR